MSVPTHGWFSRVTSHIKAMEDAVEIGLRSAFNGVGFTSFGKVLPGLKLKGEQLPTSYGPRLTAFPAGKQALSYYFTDELHEFLEAAIEWHDTHDRSDLNPFLKEYGERLKTRVQVGLRLVFLPRFGM